MKAVAGNGSVKNLIDIGSGDGRIVSDQLTSLPFLLLIFLTKQFYSHDQWMLLVLVKINTLNVIVAFRI